MQFPGLRRSGSGSRVLHKGADSAGPAFRVLPRPGSSGDPVLGMVPLPMWGHVLPLPRPSRRFRGVQWECGLGSALGVLGELVSAALLMDANCPGPQEDLVSNWEPARSLGADANCPGPQEDLVSTWESARSLARDAVSGAEIAPRLPALAAARLPLCLWQGMGRSAAS